MRVTVLAQHWPGPDAPTAAPDVARIVTEAWSGAAVDAFAVGDGGPRSADALAGPRTRVGGAEVVEAGGSLVLAPADGSTRWEPTALATALLGLAADHAAGPVPTVVVPVGDTSPAGDAADVWQGGVEQLRSGLRSIGLVAAVGSQRPLLGLRGMSAALRDGRENDPAIALASQQQEERWGAIARSADAVAAQRSLLGGQRLSDAAGSGAAGGLAYCLAAAGADLKAAAPLLASLTGAPGAAAEADLVVAIVPELTPRALDEGAARAAASLAATRGLPAVVLAPDTRIGRRDLMNAGLAGIHEGQPGVDGLQDAVRRLAQTWRQ